MNAKKILDQLMRQAGGSSSSYERTPGAGRSGGMDVKGLVGNLASQLSGKSAGSKGQGGFDMTSLAGTGALGMLLGSRRRKSGSLLKYAALAGIGKLAWDAYQNHQANAQANPTTQTPARAPASQGQPLEELPPQAQDQRGLELLQAMIMAARADGHIDAAERAQLTQEIETLGADAELNAWVRSQFDAPLDARALASKADSPQAGREMYLVSVAIIDDQNPLERAWLDELAQALGIDAALAKQIEEQVRER